MRARGVVPLGKRSRKLWAESKDAENRRRVDWGSPGKGEVPPRRQVLVFGLDDHRLVETRVMVLGEGQTKTGPTMSHCYLYLQLGLLPWQHSFLQFAHYPVGGSFGGFTKGGSFWHGAILVCTAGAQTRSPQTQPPLCLSGLAEARGFKLRHPRRGLRCLLCCTRRHASKLIFGSSPYGFGDFGGTNWAA